MNIKVLVHLISGLWICFFLSDVTGHLRTGSPDKDSDENTVQIIFKHAMTEDGDTLYLSASIKTSGPQELVTSVNIEVIPPNGSVIRIAEAFPVEVDPNDVTATKVIWNGKIPKDIKIPANALVRVTTNLSNVATIPLTYQASCHWVETEEGWKGNWRRRFNDPSIFDATWTSTGQKPVTATLFVSIEGKRVTIKRESGSDKKACTYTGAIEGKTISGSFTCAGRDGKTSPWSVIISDTCK